MRHGSSFVNVGDDIFEAANMTDEMLGGITSNKVEMALKAPEVTSLEGEDSGSEDSLDSLDIQLLHANLQKKYEQHHPKGGGRGGESEPERNVLGEGEDAAFFSAPRYLSGGVSSGVPSSRASSRESSRSNLGAQGYSAIYNNRKR
ncbi:hypothetical protein TL16_g12010 [Triparma laevis f. inornata]|uniref:Uncharacterized protein n=1 Tax=Triparma laevis f. inornata TaxID=1714386 RepID=A0A9W7ETN2_9STRA|nr:hypothetical protein TL16_g12010 [Triparma laevis f. inornata]